MYFTEEDSNYQNGERKNCDINVCLIPIFVRTYVCSPSLFCKQYYTFSYQ